MRLADWPARLNRVVAAAHPRPFTWAVQDCCLWAADCVLACTGVDPALGLRGQYFDAVTANRVLRAIGGLRGAGARMGAPIAPAYAAEGDVGLLIQRRPMLGVCIGGLWLVAATRGLQPLPFDSARLAWGVGRG